MLSAFLKRFELVRIWWLSLLDETILPIMVRICHSLSVHGVLETKQWISREMVCQINRWWVWSPAAATTTALDGSPFIKCQNAAFSIMWSLDKYRAGHWNEWWLVSCLSGTDCKDINTVFSEAHAFMEETNCWVYVELGNGFCSGGLMLHNISKKKKNVCVCPLMDQNSRDIRICIHWLGGHFVMIATSFWQLGPFYFLQFGQLLWFLII